jgi:hypothetical protein
MDEASVPDALDIVSGCGSQGSDLAFGWLFDLACMMAESLSDMVRRHFGSH